MLVPSALPFDMFSHQGQQEGLEIHTKMQLEDFR